MTLQLPYVDPVSGCIYLDDASPCGPEYYGYPIKGNLIPGFPANYSELANYISLFGSTDKSAVDIASAFKCQVSQIADQVAGLRYQTSFLCSNLVLWSLLPTSGPAYPNAPFNGGGCPLPSIVGSALKANGPLICKEQCDIVASGIQNIIGDASICTDTAAVSLKLVKDRQACDAYVGFTSESGGCLAGIAKELNLCGFRNEDQAKKYCPALTGSDPCCAKLIGLNQQSPAPSSPTQSKPFSLPVPIIAAIVGGVVLIAAVIVGFIVICKKRGRAKKPKNLNNRASIIPAHAKYPHGRTQEYDNGASSAPNMPASTKFIPASPVSDAAYQEDYQNMQLEQQQEQQQKARQQRQNEQHWQHQQKLEQQQLQEQQHKHRLSSAALTALPRQEHHHDRKEDSAPDPVILVIHPYVATLPDELTLVLGERIMLLKSFDDGWALGLDIKTGAQGAFPLVCVAQVGENQMNGDAATSDVDSDSVRISRRMSSAVFSASQLSALSAVAAKSISAVESTVAAASEAAAIPTADSPNVMSDKKRISVASGHGDALDSAKGSADTPEDIVEKKRISEVSEKVNTTISTSDSRVAKTASLAIEKKTSDEKVVAVTNSEAASEVDTEKIVVQNVAPLLPPAVMRARSVKFDSGVPPQVHVYPRESVQSDFSYSSSEIN